MDDARDEDPEREQALLDALLSRRFDLARGYLRGARLDRSPYRTTVDERLAAASAAERAIDLIERGEPVAAHFCLIDAEGEEPHPLEPAIQTVIGALCEAAGELVVARAAHLAGLTYDDALRIEAAVPMTTDAMDDAVNTRALALYRKGVEERPHDLALREAYVVRLARGGDVAAAEEAARQLIERAPTRPAAHLVLVDLLATSEREDEARQASRAACEACADVASVWIARGDLLEQAGQADEAHAAFERALALEPDAWAAHLGLERLLVAGDARDLVAHYRRMLPHAEDGGQEDRIADEIDRLEGELAGGEAVLEARRAIARRREERAAAIDELITPPRVAGAQHRAQTVGIASLVLAGLVIALAVVVGLAARR